MEAGTYKGAMIKDYGFTKPKGDKNPQAMVQFEFVDPDGNKQNITWFGSFNGGAKEFTVKTLVDTLGFKGRTGAELVEGIGSNILNEVQDYELDIELHTWEGKTRPRIKYINLPGASRMVEKLTKDEATIFVGGLNLAGEIATQRQRTGKPAPQQKQQPQPPPINYAENIETPF